MKKGRHRRFEEARALKRSNEGDIEDIFGNAPRRCDECGADPGDPHASWCMAEGAVEEEFSYEQ